MQEVFYDGNNWRQTLDWDGDYDTTVEANPSSTTSVRYDHSASPFTFE